MAKITATSTNFFYSLLLFGAYYYLLTYPLHTTPQYKYPRPVNYRSPTVSCAVEPCVRFVGSMDVAGFEEEL